jgi:perosamine synthetase
MSSELAIFGGPHAVTGKPFRWPPVEPQDIQAVSRLMANAELSYYGREGAVATLEDAFSAYHGGGYALAVSSGTAALHSAFAACGVRPGTEVIAPSHTFLATVMPILAAGGSPVLVDCEEDSECLDPAGIAAAITERTVAIVVTHLWGHPAEMDEILRIARGRGLRVIEDCSHAHGAAYRGQMVGTTGDVACFSLQAKKIVSAGQGGMLLTRDREIFERAVLFGHFNVRAIDEVLDPALAPFAATGSGLNYRMHPLAAALAVAQLQQLDERIELRGKKLGMLSELLAPIPGVVPPQPRAHVTMGGWYGYKPRYRADQLGGLSLDTFVAALQAEGAQVKRPGSAPLHLAPMFSAASAELADAAWPQSAGRPRYQPGDLPVCERVHETALSLPTFTYEPDELVEQYGRAFAKVAGHAAELSERAESR